MKLPEQSQHKVREWNITLADEQMLTFSGATYVLGEYGATFYSYAGEAMLFLPHSQIKWISVEEITDVDDIDMQ